MKPGIMNTSYWQGSSRRKCRYKRQNTIPGEVLGEFFMSGKHFIITKARTVD